MTIEMPVMGEGDTSPRRPGFLHPFPVDVQQTSDEGWQTLRELIYQAKTQTFAVPVGQPTDFASVPRVFVWFIPRYGRYTKAAILHDYLCRVEVPAGNVTRIDADGIFRQAMRELGVPFLRRWIMWAGVRLGALGSPAGRQKWWTQAWRVALVALVAVPVVLPAAVLITTTLLVFWLAEWLAWLPLQVVRELRGERQPQAKKVNQPQLRWRL